MKSPDLDKLHSEKRLTLERFMSEYNKDLPELFPRVSVSLLEKYQEVYAYQFKGTSPWSLDQHRKKVMDWLPGHLKKAVTP